MDLPPVDPDPDEEERRDLRSEAWSEAAVHPGTEDNVVVLRPSSRPKIKPVNRAR